MEETMCKIDAPFGNLPLDEKSDSAERFEQALDEYGANGSFRSVLIEHFQKIWKDAFDDVENLEASLKCAQQHDSVQDKLCFFLANPSITQKLESLLFYWRYSVQSNSPIRKSSELIGVIRDIAQTYFVESPYRLFKSMAGHRTAYFAEYYWFVNIIFDPGFCLSKNFFADAALASEPNERNQTLWEYFESMTGQTESNGNYSSSGIDPQIKNLISAAAANSNDEILPRATREFLRGIEFLEAWIEYETKFCLSNDGIQQLKIKLDDKWYEFEDILKSMGNASEQPGNDIVTATQWLKTTKSELDLLFLVHRDLTARSLEQRDEWAQEMDSHFSSPRNIYCNVDPSNASDDQLNTCESEYLTKVCSKLHPLQIKTWIQWEIRQQSKQTKPDLYGFYGSEKWFTPKHSTIWKEAFKDEFICFDYASRLKLLSSVPRFPDRSTSQEHDDWWNGLLRDLIKDDDFPSQLIPEWTVIALRRLEPKELISHVDQSIGILRRELSEAPSSEHHQKLDSLFNLLDREAGSKALRHRLQLMRSSKDPFSDENLSRFSSMNDGNTIKWFRSFIDLTEIRFLPYPKSFGSISAQELEQKKADSFHEFSIELAEFFLSRLRLRKGEKAIDGQYDTNQLIEPSPIWRQGYLKALSEIGLDLKGKVHKTAHFIRQSDPDENVRMTAKECYRSVRRGSKKDCSLPDLKRGLIAAEWWLFLCQRQDLGLEVNHEEALKTRRRMLRNP
jgi:hypothetical protein